MTTNSPHTIRKPVGVGFWTELGKGKEEAIPLEIFFKPSHGYGKFYIYFTLAPQRISYFTQWLPKAIFFILVGSNRGWQELAQPFWQTRAAQKTGLSRVCIIRPEKGSG